MFSRFFPKETDFYVLFNHQIAVAIDLSNKFYESVSAGGISPELMKQISDMEHKADEYTHKIIDELNETFITPFDREDIHSLAVVIDDIIDMITTISHRIVIYKLTSVNKNLVEFAKLIKEAVVAVSEATQTFHDKKNMKKTLKACIEVNRLENVGDKLRDKSLAELFETEKDFIAVIKWKEIYQDAESVLDVCEDVAHIIENILVKQG